MNQSLDIQALQAAYRAGHLTPAQVIDAVYQRIEHDGLRPVWIALVPREEALARAHALDSAAKDLPLYGIPFAVKDNIDVAGMPTTAGCPAFARVPEITAFVVQRLLDAGAILIGKTNLDQFATGLVGVRSPYGACSSVFDDRYLSGGSSSGSAVAVARGLVSFSLGTDTAGSGRVPAAFNNIVGLKPSRGLLSTSGVLPACRSLDCVSIFALSHADAATVFAQARGFDNRDAYSRVADRRPGTAWPFQNFRFGVLAIAEREFFGDAEAERLYQDSIDALQQLGGRPVEINYQPFRQTASLLYAGPWVAERLAAIESFIHDHQADLHPVVRNIIAGASRFSAVDAFRGAYDLELLRRETAAEWQKMDVLLLPTTGTIYTKAAVEADPVQLNTNLGYYTNFVNLLDLSATAVPAGLRASNSLPFGVTLIGPTFADAALLELGDRLHRATSSFVGHQLTRLADLKPLPMAQPPHYTPVAVVGAHLTGQPLNQQLLDRGAWLWKSTKTAPGYRFYALPGTVPLKPGLVRTPGFTGPGIELEIWMMPQAEFAGFVELIPPPLSIGTVELADGGSVKGFLCEPFAIEGADDITHYAGWRAYLRSRP